MRSPVIIIADKMQGMLIVDIVKALHNAEKVAIDVYVLGRMRSVGAWPLREV